MALSDRINTQHEKPMSGMPCSIGTLLDHLEGAEREALLTMLGSPEKRSSWSQTQIYDALTGEGYEVGLQTINKHRGGRCRCPKVAS